MTHYTLRPTRTYARIRRPPSDRHGTAELRTALAERVPEIADGSVQIMAVARRPGSGAKIAVRSAGGALSPVSVCIGMHGMRIRDVKSR